MMFRFGGTSFCVERSLAMLCGSEFVLVFREMMESGRGSIKGRVVTSESLPRIGSGDGCMELFVVRTPDSGDMMGEVCCGLDAMDELVMADVGAAAMLACSRLVVWTWLGRGLLSFDDASVGGGGVEPCEGEGEDVSCDGIAVFVLLDDMMDRSMRRSIGSCRWALS